MNMIHSVTRLSSSVASETYTEGSFNPVIALTDGFKINSISNRKCTRYEQKEMEARYWKGGKERAEDNVGQEEECVDGRIDR